MLVNYYVPCLTLRGRYTVYITNAIPAFKLLFYGAGHLITIMTRPSLLTGPAHQQLDTMGP